MSKKSTAKKPKPPKKTSLGKSPLRQKTRKSKKVTTRPPSGYPKVTVLPPSQRKFTHPAQHFDYDSKEMYFGFQLPIEIEAEDGTLVQKIVNCLVSEKGETIPCTESELKRKGITLIAKPLVTKKKGNRISNVVLAEWQRSGGRKPLTWDIPDYLKFVIDTLKEMIDFQDPLFFIYAALWIFGTYCHRLFESFPYTFYGGPTGTGKTRTMEVIEQVAFNAILSPNMSPSALFRTVESRAPVLLMDETETLHSSDASQEIRQLVLSGYKKGAAVMRVEQTKDGGFTTETYGTYCPKCFANIRGLDDVLSNRCITTLMTRSKNKAVMTAKLSTRDRRIKWQQIRDQTYLLTFKHWKRVSELTELHADKEIVEGINGRPLELWSPIFILAELFEENGCVDLRDTVTELALKQVEAMLEAFRDSPEGQIIRALKELMMEDGMREAFYPFQDLMPFVARQATFAELGTDEETGEEIEVKIRKPRWLTPPYLTRKLRLLGIDNYKGYGSGRSFNLSREILIDLWERYMGSWEEPEVQTGLFEFGDPDDMTGKPQSIVTLSPDDPDNGDSARAECDEELIRLNMDDKSWTKGGFGDHMKLAGKSEYDWESVFNQMIAEGKIVAKGTTPTYYRLTPDMTEKEDEKDE